MKKQNDGVGVLAKSQPRIHRRAHETQPPVQISRLLEALELILREARSSARLAAEAGDDGTNDLLVSDVIRTNELQVWFLSEHVVATPLVHAT